MKHRPSVRPSVRPFNADRSDQFGLIVYRPSFIIHPSLVTWSARSLLRLLPGSGPRGLESGLGSKRAFRRDTNLAYRKRCGGFLSAERVRRTSLPSAAEGCGPPGISPPPSFLVNGIVILFIVRTHFGAGRGRSSRHFF